MKRIVLITGLLACVCAAQAQLPLQQVTIFKDGTAFFMRKGTVRTDAGGTWKLTELPPALNGSLWFEGDQKTVRAYQDTLKKNELTTDPLAFWKANAGKRLRLRLGSEDDFRVVEGVADSLLGNHLLVKTRENTWQMVDARYLKDVELLDAPVVMGHSQEIKPVVELGFDKSGSWPVRQYYFARGIQWAPAYRILLLPDNKLKLDLRATLVSQSEELKNVEVRFVVGVPNIRFSDDLDALVSWLNTPRLYRPAPAPYANVMTQRVMFEAKEEAVADEMPMNTTDPDAGKQDGLFYYTYSNISLPKGGRAYYSLLDVEAPYEDLYEVDLGNNQDRIYAYEEGSTSREATYPVWHKIRFKNTTKLPWTTAPALVLRGQQDERNPLSQDIINYTPAGALATLPITINPNVKVTHAEKELERLENQRLADKNYYDVITAEGTLEISNFGDKEMTLEATRFLVGETLKSSEKWEVRAVPTAYSAVNRRSEVKWKLTLKPGQTLKVTYTYKINARR
ncbi:MAG: hypothetical protein KF690_00220 [Bacteroidetes bacterium]|nr:hypothetical protein [Bacteroidota bacterium]